MNEETKKDVFKRHGFSSSYPSPIERVFSDEEIAKANQQLKDEARERTKDLGFFELYAKQQTTQGLAFEAYDYVQGLTERGEGEVITPEMSKELLKDLDDERAIENVLRGVNKYGFQYGLYLSNLYRESNSAKKDLRDSGMKGFGAQLLSDFTDPAENAIMFTTAAGVAAAAPPLAPVTAPVAAGGVRVARLISKYKNANYLKLAFGAGATEQAAFDLLRAQSDYEIGGGDIMLNATLAGTLTAGFAKGHQTFRKYHEAENIKRKIADDEELTEAEEAFVRQYSPEVRNPQVLSEALARDDFNTGVRPDDDEFGVVEGAFEQDTRTLRDIPDDEAPLEMMGGALNLRGFIASMPRIMNSKDKLARKLGSKLGLISSGLKGTTSPFGANELRDAFQSQVRGRMANPIRRIQEQYKRTVPNGKLDDLHEQATEYLRYGDESVHPLAKEMANLMRPEIDRMLAQAQKFGVAGFLPDADMRLENYLPRFRNTKRIKELREKYGKNAEIFDELAEQAIREGQPNIVANITRKLKEAGKDHSLDAVNAFIKKMATGYIRRFMNLDTQDGMRLGNNDVDLEEFESFLRLDFDDAEVDIIIDTLTYSRKVKGNKRSIPRMQLNERATITKQIGDEVVTLRFDDLLEKNAISIFDGLTFQMSGSIALARNGIDTNEVGSAFKQQLELLKSRGKVADSEIKALEFLYETVRGTHVYRSDMSPTTIRNLARLREFSFAVSMGMSGLASLMELPMVTLPYGWEVLRKTVPQFPELFRGLKNKEIRSKLGREMAAGTGLGSDGIVQKVTPIKSRLEGEGLEGIQFNEELNKLDEVLGYGRVYMGIMSGLTGVTDMLRRISNFNFAHKWHIYADKGRLPFSKVHREQLGITDEQAEGMLEQIRKHRTLTPDGELDALNVDKWDADKKDLADLFFLAARREGTQNVLEMNAGSVNRHLRTPLGMTMFQFLSFPMSSMEQIAFRLGVRATNGEAMEISKLLVSSMMLGTLMYGARTYLNSMGRDDQDDYLERNLTMGKVLAGGISNVGAASLGGYIYQVSNSLIDGNTRALTPAGLSLVAGVGKGIGDLYEIAQGDNLTESEVRGMLRLLPFSSLLGARQILNGIASGFPEQ